MNGAVHRRSDYDDVEEAANYLLNRTSHRPCLGLICGSGLGGLAEQLRDVESFDYKDIPHYPVSTVPGHAGRLVFGKMSGKRVVCMQGRVHFYEGYTIARVTFPVRVMKALGVTTLITTNAAGGLNEYYNEGDVMVLKDHINFLNFSGINPLQGVHDERFGIRFPAMSGAYDAGLRQLCRNVAKDLDFEGFVREGVLSVLGGPSFETVAECRLLRFMGADATGMSVVPEVIVARQGGMRVLAMSLITNKCVMDYDTDSITNHEEVLEVGRARASDMQSLVARIVEQIDL